MKATAGLLNVSHFDISGYLKLSADQKKSKGTQYFATKNEINFGTQWQLVIGIDLAMLIISSNYEPVNKLDLSILASYKAHQQFTFTDTNDLKNEISELDKVAEIFHQEITTEYNKRIAGTPIQVPFPTADRQKLDQFRQRLSVSLHKALEKRQNL